MSERLFNRFEVIRRIGQGAAGAVFLVRDEQSPGQELALKLLNNSQAFDEHTLERFRREFAVCRSIDHPNVVKAYDLLEQGGAVGFTMEYVAGRDLSKMMAEKRLSFEEIDAIMGQLLLGIEELHRHDVVHRDIKLENVLVGYDNVVKLSDLGLMRQLDKSLLTRAGVLLGTAAYMPPEYIRGGYYERAGDIYAAGLVLYELLTHKRRLADVAGNAAIEHLIKTKFEIPRMPLAGLPRRYLAIIDRALAVAPENRFSSALEMKRAMSGEMPAPVEKRWSPPVRTMPYHTRTARPSMNLEIPRAAPARAFNWAPAALALTAIVSSCFVAFPDELNRVGSVFWSGIGWLQQQLAELLQNKR